MKTEAEGKPAIKSPGRVFQRKGSSYWWIGYSLDGQEYRESTHTTDLQQAEKFLKHRLRQVGAAQLRIAEFITPRMEKVRVSELLDALADDYQLRGKASAQFRSSLKYVREAFGHWRALVLTAEKVDDYIKEQLEANWKPATINRRTQLLKQAYKLAIERKHLSKAPVIRHLSEEGNTRQGFFSEADFREVLKNLPEYLQDFCLFGYLVGWRKNECATLDWEDVDGDTIGLKGINSKNGKPRMIVLTGELVELMERRKGARAVRTASGGVMLSALVFHREGQPDRQSV